MSTNSSTAYSNHYYPGRKSGPGMGGHVGCVMGYLSNDIQLNNFFGETDIISVLKNVENNQDYFYLTKDNQRQKLTQVSSNVKADFLYNELKTAILDLFPEEFI